MYFKNADAREVDTYRLSMHAIVALYMIPAHFHPDEICFKVFIHANERIQIDKNQSFLDRENKPVSATKMYSVDGNLRVSGYASLKSLAILSKDERIAAINFTHPEASLNKPTPRPSSDIRGPEPS